VLISQKRMRWRKWIRVREEPEKELMLASAKRSPKAAASLASIGLVLRQEEAFFIKPKETSAAVEAKAS